MKCKRKKLGESLIESNLTTENNLQHVLELDTRYIDIKKLLINPETPKYIDEKLARRHCVIPVSKEGNIITLAMADPLDIIAIDDVRVMTGFEINAVRSIRKDIENAIDSSYENETARQAIEEIQ